MPSEPPYDEIYSVRTTVLAAASGLVASTALFAGLAVTATGFRFPPVSPVAYARQPDLPVWVALVVGASFGTGLASALWYPYRAPAALEEYLYSPWTEFGLSAVMSLFVYGAAVVLRPLAALALLLGALVLTLVGPLVFLVGVASRDWDTVAGSLGCLVCWLLVGGIATLNDGPLEMAHSFNLFGFLTVAILVPLVTILAGETSVDEFPDDRSAGNLVDAGDEPAAGGGRSGGLLPDLGPLLGRAFGTAAGSASGNPAGDRTGGAADPAPADGPASEGASGSLADCIDFDAVEGPRTCLAATASGGRCSRSVEAGEHTCWQHDESEVPADESASADGRTHVHETEIESEGARAYVIAPAAADDDDAVAAFTGAVDRWRGIAKNAGVATVVESGTDPRPWVAFDDGWGPLVDHVEDIDASSRQAVALDVAEAVRTAGMYNVTHGGIDPSVAHLDEGGAERTATLAGWGLRPGVERAVGDTDPTPFTAPEQLDGAAAGPRTDVYGLGALTYYVLAGEEPFADAADLRAAIETGDRPVPTDRNSSLAPAVDDVVRTAMAIEPDARYGDPSAFRQALVAAFE